MLIPAALLLAGCWPAQPAPTITPQLAPTATSQHDTRATQPPVEVTRRQEPTAVPEDIVTEDMEIVERATCDSSGEVRCFLFDPELMNEELYVSVYIPPCYDPDFEGGYPVLYLLHGQEFNDSMWLDLGAGEIADDLINSGAVQPFLMVFPYEEFYYREADNNAFPDTIMEEVIPFVESSFNTCAERECRAIGGISRGASWAIRIGLESWDMFSAIGAHSLPTFSGDVGRLPNWLENIPDESVPLIYMDIGRFDPEVKLAYSFEQVLNEKGVPHEWHLNEGRHNTDYWAAHIREYLLWYASGWEEME